MSNSVVQSIVHPTDFSDVSDNAFAHALRIALAARCKLDLLHVDSNEDENAEQSFPHVRRKLAAWKLMHEDDLRTEVQTKLGIGIRKIEIGPTDPLKAITEYLNHHPAELLVLGTEGRAGWRYLMKGSMAESISRAAHASTLFIRTQSRGFVDQSNGDLLLNRVLMPIDPAIKWDGAFNQVSRFVDLLNFGGVEIRLLHVGDQSPVAISERSLDSVHIELRSGLVVETILQTAFELDVDLIAMPTAGHHGVMDALRGSTTERVLHHAPCPLLAIPAR